MSQVQLVQYYFMVGEAKTQTGAGASLLSLNALVTERIFTFRSLG